MEIVVRLIAPDHLRSIMMYRCASTMKDQFGNENKSCDLFSYLRESSLWKAIRRRKRGDVINKLPQRGTFRFLIASESENKKANDGRCFRGNLCYDLVQMLMNCRELISSRRNLINRIDIPPASSVLSREICAPCLHMCVAIDLSVWNWVAWFCCFCSRDEREKLDEKRGKNRCP